VVRVLRPEHRSVDPLDLAGGATPDELTEQMASSIAPIPARIGFPQA
jgi:hypothetical protein